MKSLWPILSLIGLGLLQGLVVAQGASETTVSSLPTQTTSTIPSDSATTPTGLPTVSPIFSCPRNCSGIGTCLQDGSCLCPITDPRTGIRWFTPPTPDCYFYGAAAFGVELITFQVSWALLNLFGVFIMIALLASLYRENGNRIPNNVKSLCFSLITLGFLVRAIFFTVDPYSIRQIVNPILTRILYNVFYPIVLMAYCTMLLQWIEVCSPSSEFTRGRYLSLTKVAAGILVVIFIAMEIITSLLHARSDGNTIPVYFIVYYTFAGLIVFATVPFYVIFGNHFRKHLESYPGASKDPSILKLKRKILFLSYAPGSLLIISFLTIGLAVRYTRRDPSLFLIGESLARFCEMITMGVFVFALFTRREGDDDDPFNEDGQDHGRAMSFKSSSDGDQSTLRRGAYFLDTSSGSDASSYSGGYYRSFMPSESKTIQDPFSSAKHQGAMF